MGIVDLASVATLHTERKSCGNCRLEEAVFKERERTAGNQTIEAVLKLEPIASEARCDYETCPFRLYKLEKMVLLPNEIPERTHSFPCRRHDLYLFFLYT
jgi:hypothetical protein